MNAKRLIGAAVEHVRASAAVKRVFGEPIQVNGKTFIPVANLPPPTAPGPVAAQPLGVVEIEGTKARFLPFGQGKRLAWVATISATVGVLVGRIFGQRAGRRAGF